MRRWGVMVSAGLLALALAAPAAAQLPVAGGSGLTNVPIDTTKNLAAPIPLMPQVRKKSFLEKTGDTLKRLNPFAGKPAPAYQAQMPTNQLPKNMQAPPQQQGSGFKLPELPKVPSLISGGFAK